MSLHSSSSVNGEGTSHKEPLSRILDELSSLKLCVTTYPSAGGRCEIKMCLPKKKRTRGSCYQRLFKEKVRKNQKEVCKFQRQGVRELFTRGKGIGTPHVRHKGRQPLIECAKNVTSILFIFPFLCFFIFLGSTRVLPLLLHIHKCDEEFRPT